MSFQVGPTGTYPVTGAGFTGPGGAAISAEIGPIDYPDSSLRPARFIRDRAAAFRDPARRRTIRTSSSGSASPAACGPGSTPATPTPPR